MPLHPLNTTIPYSLHTTVYRCIHYMPQIYCSMFMPQCGLDKWLFPCCVASKGSSPYGVLGHLNKAVCNTLRQFAYYGCTIEKEIQWRAVASRPSYCILQYTSLKTPIRNAREQNCIIQCIQYCNTLQRKRAEWFAYFGAVAKICSAIYSMCIKCFIVPHLLK